MLSFVIKVLLISFSVTVICELGLAFLLKVRDKKDLLNVFLVNVLTNPLLVSLSLYINIAMGLKWRNILIYPMEIVVVLVEGFIYKKYLNYKKINPLLLSFILNLSSYLMGLLVNYLVY